MQNKNSQIDQQSIRELKYEDFAFLIFDTLWPNNCEFEKGCAFGSVTVIAHSSQLCPICRNYVIATTNDDEINIFHAGDFNITKAQKAKKCDFSTNETSERGYVERRGLELDKKCQICNIFSNKDYLELVPLVAADKWCLWTFICRDLPRHACQQVNPNARILRPFDQEVEKICQANAELPTVFSFDRWQDYIHKGMIFQNAEEMIECIRAKSCLLPSILSKHVFFDKHLGMAVFRDGISPDYNCPMNAKGGYFQLHFYYAKNDHNWLLVLDEMFHKFVKFVIKRLSPEMAAMVNGIFVRCEIAYRYKPENNINDYQTIPILIKIELWIQDEDYVEAYANVLANWTQDARFTNFHLRHFA